MSGMFEGRVVAIYTAPGEGEPMQAHDEAEALAGQGLAGDRYAIDAGKYSGTKVGKRAITLIEREALAQANDTYDLGMTEEETRRNVVVEGVPLNHLVGHEFLVGGVRLRGFDLSEPCVYLEGLTGKAARKALLHRGGLRAEILEGGPIRIGDAVRPDAG
jgi:MOSC domain-containing protein YiiM